MSLHIVHHKLPHGWISSWAEADTAEDARIKDIESRHLGLPKPHVVEMDGDNFEVVYTGPEAPMPMGLRIFPGMALASGVARIGQEADCRNCGGTGENFWLAGGRCSCCNGTGKVKTTARNPGDEKREDRRK